jgi:IS4 transposase
MLQDTLAKPPALPTTMVRKQMSASQQTKKEPLYAEKIYHHSLVISPEGTL